MATRRKPTARKPAARRAATGTAKIRVHTDEYGRKVYTVVGTKKYAYTLAKAKELAAKKAPKKRASSKKSTALTTTRKRTTVAKRKPTTRRRTTGAKRNAKGQFVKAGRRTTTRRNARRLPPPPPRGTQHPVYAGEASPRRNAKRRKSKRGLSGITLAQTKTVARNILREVSGEDPMSEYGRKAIARDVKRAGVITGLTAESAYMEGGVDETMLPASLRGKGYFDFDNAHRMFWTKM